MLRILVLVLTSCGCITFPARYTPVTAEGNACESQCEIARSSCRAVQGTCMNRLSDCRRRCFQFHGGELVEPGEDPVRKDAPVAAR